MRINCPCCGERGLDEFVYHGDASVTRPDALAPSAMADFVSYVYERTNTPGLHRELWFHAAGCHSWLVVTRGKGLSGELVLEWRETAQDGAETNHPQEVRQEPSIVL